MISTRAFAVAGLAAALFSSVSTASSRPSDLPSEDIPAVRYERHVTTGGITEAASFGVLGRIDDASAKGAATQALADSARSFLTRTPELSGGIEPVSDLALDRIAVSRIG